MVPVKVLVLGMNDKIGGIETFLKNYYSHIDRSHVQLDFISTFDKLCFEDFLIENKAKIYHITPKKKNFILYCVQLKKIIIENNYKIVHINMSEANILPILVSRFAKVTHVIAHSHNSNTQKGIIKKILNFTTRYFLRFATDYFACSKLAGEWLFGKKFLLQKKLIIINNAIDLDFYKFNIEECNKLRKSLDMENKYVIGHIGRFCYQKNHEFLIKIFYEVQKKIDNAILLLIGEGDLKANIKNMVTKLNISHKVIFFGVTNEIYKYMNCMNVFLLPSRFEGLPVTAIEAQASGLPCLLSNTITKETDISGNVSFLPISFNSIDIWKNKIIEIKNSNIRFNNLKNIEKNGYNINVESKKLENIYINFIKN